MLVGRSSGHEQRPVRCGRYREYGGLGTPFWWGRLRAGGVGADRGGVSGVITRRDGAAGGSAQRRYLQLRGAWRRRVRWGLAAAAGVFVVLLAASVGWAVARYRG